MSTCKQIIELLSDYLEGDMSPAQREAFEAHMSACPPCVVFLEDLKTTRVLIEGLRCEEVPQEVQSRLRSFLERRRKGPSR
jgi:anti-sigma factor RsiW